MSGWCTLHGKCAPESDSLCRWSDRFPNRAYIQRYVASREKPRGTYASATAAVFFQGLLGDDGRNKRHSPDKQGQDLLHYIRQHWNNVQVDGIDVAYVDGQGRGIVANSIFVPGQPVMSLPLEYTITPERAMRESILLSRISEGGAAKLPDWTILAVWLAEQRLGFRQDLPVDNDSTHYVGILPKKVGNVLEWSDYEVHLLTGSHLYTLAEDIRGATNASYEDIRDVVGHTIPDPRIFEHEFRRSLAILLSRLVRISDDTEALCPCLDFLNHASDCRSFIRYNENSRKVELIADRLYTPGTQVYASYGEKTNGELFLSYGFIPEEENPHDACLFPISLWVDNDGIHASDFKRALEASGLPSVAVFPLKVQGLPDGILFYAAVKSILQEEASEEHAASLLDRYRSRDSNSKDSVLHQEEKRVAIHWLIDACKSRVSQYVVQRDQKLAMTPTAELICKLMLQEERVLQRNLFILRQMLKSTRTS